MPCFMIFIGAAVVFGLASPGRAAAVGWVKGERSGVNSLERVQRIPVSRMWCIPRTFHCVWHWVGTFVHGRSLFR